MNVTYKIKFCDKIMIEVKKMSKNQLPILLVLLLIAIYNIVKMNFKIVAIILGIIILLYIIFSAYNNMMKQELNRKLYKKLKDEEKKTKNI